MTQFPSLLDSLPKVRGRYQENVDLSKILWFKAGGTAQVIYKPQDYDDLGFFLKNCPKDIPCHILGVGSNLLVRDGGVPGVIIRLGSAFAHVLHHGEIVDVGAGYLDRNLAQFSAEKGLRGLGFLAGIPGTIGGAVAMNAGCYGGETKDVLIHAVVMDTKGKVHHMTPQDLSMQYRSSQLPEGWIVLGAQFRVTKDKPEVLLQEIEELTKTREETQPIQGRTGGSTFKNPKGQKAWELIDKAGCRGLKVGGAQMSEKHCNFMINTGDATAADLEALGEQVRQRVKDATGIELEWEIQRWGNGQQKEYKQVA